MREASFDEISTRWCRPGYQGSSDGGGSFGHAFDPDPGGGDRWDAARTLAVLDHDSRFAVSVQDRQVDGDRAGVAGGVGQGLTDDAMSRDDDSVADIRRESSHETGGDGEVVRLGPGQQAGEVIRVGWRRLEVVCRLLRRWSVTLRAVRAVPPAPLCRSC